MTDTGTVQPVDRFVDVPNFRIHYVEAGTGHPVVLLHGSGPGATGLTNFSPNIGPLAAKFRVIAVDMPGWGESDTQTEETGRDHVKALVDLLDKLGIDKAALVGNSMGGVTSVSAAILHPERVSHLVTMGTPAPIPGVFSPGGGLTEGLKILMHAYREPTPENMKRLVQVMCFDQKTATDELAAARSAAALARPDHLDSWNAQYSGPPKMPPYWELAGRLGAITAPTLIMHGRDDRVVHFENSLQLVTRIQDSRMVLFNRCGHWAQIEHAAEFNRLVSAFIDA
ncbi:2-hydroxy-6-oxonona-2,4-dienedioate hydrolase [Kibdelosporangium banguiense]|uniref:2-hydroxy-6-oxonona-2,4-dienedioate hydrolase n=1 Tax=Kibdelosporangium banguiense TaxID=1365924 RepID=A0ABS4T9B5_9PSEU|nr:alpha/beta hydrolase [Kibdelosporangium banguiense]MBP2320426.1 2-hydroxy-6-oxonona-2,4-dienedioate hydrolase [Kibdelosporangium banguiense]